VRTRWRIFWSIALAALAVFVTITARFFVWPPTNAPRVADAIVVLGSGKVDEMRRAEEGERLFTAGDAPVLAISDAGGPCPVKVTTAKVTCFSPSPETTQGEARMIGHMARKDHWRSIIVVSGRPQATRARMRVERCFTGRIEVVGVEPVSFEQWVYQIVYEWGATIKALTSQRGC
jgi:uncharacterized SAM-binding protein YcdF (DUF218 family)